MPVIDSAEIERRFSYHAPDTERRLLHENMRVSFKATAHVVAGLPESREKSLAMTALEESMFWANAAIARPEVK